MKIFFFFLEFLFHLSLFHCFETTRVAWRELRQFLAAVLQRSLAKVIFTLRTCVSSFEV